jgi:hypothetical protein
MARTLSERVRDWRYWVIDQGGHLLLGLGIAYAFEDMGGWGAFSFSAVLGLVRELLQNLRKDGWHGSMGDAGIDVAFWTFGAAIGSLIA